MSDDDCFYVYLDEDSTVLELKRKIHKLHVKHPHPDVQELHLSRNMILQNHKLLTDNEYKVNNGTTMNLRIANLINLTIEFSNKQQIQLPPLYDSQTILYVKNLIFEKTKKTAETQMLYFRRNLIDDKSTVYNCGIRDNLIVTCEFLLTVTVICYGSLKPIIRPVKDNTCIGKFIFICELEIIKADNNSDDMILEIEYLKKRITSSYEIKGDKFSEFPDSIIEACRNRFYEEHVAFGQKKIDEDDKEFIADVDELIRSPWRREHVLSFDVLGQIMQDDQPLVEYFVNDDDTIYMYDKPNFIDRKMLMFIGVRIPSNKVVVVTLDRQNHTIEDIKQKIHEMEQIPVELQHFVFNKEDLSSWYSLHDYGIKDGDVIDLKYGNY